MDSLIERLRDMPCGLPECDSGAIPHGPDPDGQWEAQQCQICAYIAEAADALEAKDAEIERLHKSIDEYASIVRGRDKEIVKLQAVVQDIDRWLEAFIKAWDQNAPHKGSQAPVALMEAIRQHSLVRAALEDKDTLPVSEG